MRVLVWGLGYVGTVSAACLAKLGHEVVGVEPNPAKVEALNARRSSIKEPGLENLIRETVTAGRLTAKQDGVAEVRGADVSLICVGTPAAADGGPLMDYLRNAAIDIARGLREAANYHVVVLRSTVFPGTSRSLLAGLLEQHSGRQLGRDFGLVCNPEFLRETTAIADFLAPPYTVIGALDARSGDLVQALYQGIDAPVARVLLEEAEALKLANNAFHALKVGFANEIGRLCAAVGLDSHAVMRLVCADTKLNISPAYLKPGFAFGGSCLPKDLRSLTFNARRLGVEVPILDAILPSNRLQIDAARVKVVQSGARRIGVLGLSFKPNTDDLRESPIIGLIRDLWQDGVDVLVYDPDVQPAQMLGSNLEYLERQLPQIHRILREDLEEVLTKSDMIVVAQKRPEFAARLNSLNGHTAILDMVRLGERESAWKPRGYQGLSW